MSASPLAAAIFQPKRGAAASTPHGLASLSTVSPYGASAAPSAPIAIMHKNPEIAFILFFLTLVYQ